MWSLSIVMSDCSIIRRGQGHMNNFAIASRRIQVISTTRPWSICLWHIDKTMEATRSRHGWVHMFVTHRPTVTLQLHNFGLFRTCRTSSFCTVAWQLAAFQLTRRIALSLGDSWVSYTHTKTANHHFHACLCDGLQHEKSTTYRMQKSFTVQ